MNALASAVCELMGWSDGESLRARLSRVVPQVAAASGLPEAHLRSALDARLVRQVAEDCTVNETYFFRHGEQLVATCAEVRRAFPAEKLVAWSAACSTGEEPYSLAMQFLESGASPERLEVLGTDVCERALVQARTARYPEWSFRGVSLAVRERCFQAAQRGGMGPDIFEVHPRYRAKVRFAQHNLLAPPPLRQVHLISCRNALIYFHPAAVQAALRHFDSVLVPGGFLMLGTAEQHFAGPLGFEPLVRAGLVLLRKPFPEAAQHQTPVAEPALAPLTLAPAPPPEPVLPSLEAAWRALRAGEDAEARALAEGAVASQDAEAHLLLATLDEAAGESARALEHLRRALYLDPRLIIAHVAQASLYQRLGREKDAGRARANALRQLSALAPETILRGLTPVTASELRDALEAA